MGLYINREDVRVRLNGKVKFTDDLDDENRMSYALLDRLIAEAESDVEHDLSPRYYAPFQSITTGTFKGLPQRPTRDMLRTICEIKAVVRVLETDFGSGTVVDAEKYAKSLVERYDAMVGKLLDKRKHGGEESGFKYPPLNDLRLNYMNEMADDGYAGQVLVSGQGDGGFPARRVNDPSESFWNSVVDEGDEGV